MKKRQPRELVETYLRTFSDSGIRDFVLLENLLATSLMVKSPLGSFTCARLFLDDLARDRLMIDGLVLEELLAEGERVSVRYRLKSRDPEIHEILVSEWFTIRDEKIVEITSNFDATRIRNSMMQI